MTFVPVPNDMKVAIRAANTALGATASITFDVGKAGADWTSAQQITVLTAIGTRFFTSMKPKIHPSWTIVETVGQHQGSEGEPIYADPRASYVGTGSSTPTASNTAFCIAKDTATRGRHFTGRLYQFGLQGVDMADANHVDSTQAASWITAWNLMLSDISAIDIGAQIAVASRFKRGATKGSVVPQTPAFFTFVSGFSYETLRIATVRRRLSRVTSSL